MIPAYLLYKHYKIKKKRMAEGSSDSYAELGSGIETVVFNLDHISAKVKDGQDEDVFLQGKLEIVERQTGIYIDWKPNDRDDGGWIIEGDASSRAGEIDSDLLNVDREEVKRLQFSVDIKDLRSYQCVEPKNGHPQVKFICKDGTSYIPLYFRKGGLSEFVTHLQRYATLKRSAKDATLVLFTDEKAEALEQSVSMLNLNNDFFSRMISQPYATSMTAFSKVANFVNEQITSTALDSDSVTQEEQIAAIRQLMRDEPEAASQLLRFHDVSGFEVVTQLELPQRPEIYRERAVDVATWKSFKDAEGRFINARSLKSLIFRGGLCKELRQEAWKYMLGYFNWDKSAAENEKGRSQQVDYYYKMKLQWLSFTAEQEENFAAFRDRKALIEKDVARTDRNHAFFMSAKPDSADKENVNLQKLNSILMTYCMYNFDLGYVQGMSDYLSPILVVMEDEADAFWCFVGLMNRVHKNFEMDQSTVKLRLMQLRDLLMVVNPRLANYLESHESDHMYFCFRWILVQFKREFGFEETMKLWEVLWTDLPCPNFVLLFCVAILDKQTNTIIENRFGLTEVLKHVNSLSMHIDLEEMLTSAEAIYHQLSASQDKLPRHICPILNFNPDGNSSDDEEA